MKKVLRNVWKGGVFGSVISFVWGEIVVFWFAYSNFYMDKKTLTEVFIIGQINVLGSLVMGVIMGSVLGMVFAFVKKDAKILVKILISGSIVGILHISINTATKIFDNSNDLFDILYLYQNFWLALVGFYIITAIWFGVYFHLVNVRGQPGLDEEISSPPSTS